MILFSAANRQSLKIEEINIPPNVRKKIKNSKSREVPLSFLNHFHIKTAIQINVIANPATSLYD